MTTSGGATRGRVGAGLLVVALLTACGSSSTTATDPGDAVSAAPSVPSGSSSPSSSGSSLTVSVTADEGAGPTTWTLTCDPVGGDHPAAQAACDALAALRAPFAEVPAGQLCAQVFGGPQTATVEGTWQGEPVRTSFRRTDGCEVSRWDAHAVLLGTTPAARGRSRGGAPTT